MSKDLNGRVNARSWNGGKGLTMSFGSNIDLTAILKLLGCDLGSQVYILCRLYLYQLRWTRGFCRSFS